jgi:hypothetical protein
MPAHAAEGGIDHLTYVERVQLLSCAFEIRTNAQDLFERLAYIIQRADQSAVPVTLHSTITVERVGEEYRVGDETGAVDVELSAMTALETLFARLHRRALESVPDHIRLHTASGLHKDRAFLMVGPKRAGKTTLALRLLFAGFDMSGDELVLLRAGKVTAFPRKFYVRDTSLALLPPLPPVPGHTPFTNSPTEGRLIAVDPTRFGRPWKIVPSPVSTILYLEPNHGARTRAVPCPKVDMVRHVMPESTPPASARRDWIGDLCGTVDRAETVTLRIGELDSAVREIGRILG